LAEATSRTEELAARQAALQAEIGASEQQLLDVGTRLEDGRNSEQTATANLAQLTDEAAQATASLADTQSQLQAARSELSTAQQQLADATAQAEETGAQVTDLQTQIADLETRRATLESDVAGYEEQLAALQPQVEELTATLAQRSSELETVEAQIAEDVPAATATAPTGTSYAVSAEGAARGITLTLNDDETFSLVDRLNRTVNGSYTLSQDELVLSDATGRLGNASFPMTCPLEQDETGITIGDGEGCVLSGLRFDEVEAEAQQ
jgi:peptidoglycan hydrolase CwlO-like protein